MMPAPAAPSPVASATHDRAVVAFDGDRLVASGPIGRVAESLRTLHPHAAQGVILVFDALTSELLEIDPRSPSSPAVSIGAPALPVNAPVDAPASDASTASTASEDIEPARGPGRPRLGVVAREVTLLPRHWDWLASQPGGASATLRRLVEQARSTSALRDRVRAAQESAYRFMSAVLGNQPHYEESIRALFAGDSDRFAALTEAWPRDLRDHARCVAAAAFPNSSAASSAVSSTPSSP